MLLASVDAPSRHAGHKNAAARRSVLPTRPPTAAPLSLKPDGHFQSLWWLNLAGPGGHWLGIDVHRTGTVCGAIGDATGTHDGVGSFGTLAKLPLCYKRYVLSHPRLHLPGYRYGTHTVLIHVYMVSTAIYKNPECTVESWLLQSYCTTVRYL